MTLKGLARNHGLIQCGPRSYYGISNGFAVTINDVAGGYATYSVSAFFSDSVGRSQFAIDMDAQKKVMKYATMLSDEKGYHFTFSTAKKLDRAIDAVTRKLQEAGAVGADHCAICQQHLGTDGAVMFDHDVAASVHKTCFSQKQQAIGEVEQQERQQGSNIGRGAIGALLGALIGAIMLTWAADYPATGLHAGTRVRHFC